MEAFQAGNDMKRLYEVARSGCVPSFKRLIQKDELLLNKVSLSSFTETPLHISSLLGHLDFTVALLEKYPKMASEFDSSGQSPLHLASAEGHIEIVIALLSVNKDVCSVRDQDGRIPLHLAAMRGRVKVIQELVSARPKSISELLDGDTVLHLCVKHYHLEAMKSLVNLVGDIDAELIKKQNQDGNTIMHLAVMLRQSETVKYIVEEVGEEALVITENKMGFAALDVLENCPKDLRSYEIRDILMELVRTRNEKPRRRVSVNKEKTTLWSKFCGYLDLQGNRISETQGTVMTLATLIAAMTFQSAFNPPGGVWQQDYKDGNINGICGGENFCHAGTAIMGYYNDGRAYKIFLICNTVAFVGSLIVLFLIIGGFPLRNKLCSWLLTLAMSTAILFSAFTYFLSILWVSPNNILGQMEKPSLAWIFGWFGLVLLGCFFQMIRFVNWIIKKYWKPRSSRSIHTMRAEQERVMQAQTV